MTGSRVLVTGAHGFVASELIETLLAQGRLVNASLRQRPVGGNGPPGLTVHYGLPLRAETDWSTALQGVDTVVHCAARVHVMRETAPDPLREHRAVNRDGTVQLARQAAAAGVRRFVFISTIGVHGAETTSQPFRADDAPQPHSPYALAKWEAEQALMAMSSPTGLSVSVVRPPMVYGPGAPGNFATLARAVQSGWPLPLGAVHNSRAFVAVQNLVSLLIVCIDHPAAGGQTFLASDDEDISTTDLLRRIAAAQDRPARLLPVPSGWLRAALQHLGKHILAQSLLGSLEVDIEKTRRLLGWKPPLTLNQGLEKAVEGFKQ
jgi:nucleoside-diphosphate-sugar epimerase